MPKRLDCTGLPAEPMRVWTLLPAERQGQAIRLMARLAYNLALAQPKAPPTDLPSERAHDAAATYDPQDPA